MSRRVACIEGWKAAAVTCVKETNLQRDCQVTGGCNMSSLPPHRLSFIHRVEHSGLDLQTGSRPLLQGEKSCMHKVEGLTCRNILLVDVDNRGRVGGVEIILACCCN